jgi:hypothetical protein
MKIFFLTLVLFLSTPLFAQFDCELFVGGQPKQKIPKSKKIDWGQVSSFFKPVKALFEPKPGCKEDDMKKVITKMEQYDVKNFDTVLSFITTVSTYKKNVTNNNCKNKVEVDINCTDLVSDFKANLAKNPLPMLFGNTSSSREHTATKRYSSLDMSNRIKGFQKNINQALGCNIKVSCEDFWPRLMQDDIRKRLQLTSSNYKLWKDRAAQSWGINLSDNCNLPQEPSGSTTEEETPSKITEDPKQNEIRIGEIPSLNYTDGLKRAQSSSEIISCDELLSQASIKVSSYLPPAEKDAAIKRIQSDIKRLKEKYMDLKNCKFDPYTGAVASAGASQINPNHQSSGGLDQASQPKTSSGTKRIVVDENGNAKLISEDEFKKYEAQGAKKMSTAEAQKYLTE